MLTDTWCSLQKWFYVSVCVVVVKIFFLMWTILWLGFLVTKTALQLPDQRWNSHCTGKWSHHWTTKEVSVWFSHLTPRMTAWGESSRDSLQPAWGGKGLEGPVTGPEQPELWGGRKTKPPRTTVPVLCAARPDPWAWISTVPTQTTQMGNMSWILKMTAFLT